jgi:hypothetical protein
VAERHIRTKTGTFDLPGVFLDLIPDVEKAMAVSAFGGFLVAQSASRRTTFHNLSFSESDDLAHPQRLDPRRAAYPQVLH